MASTAAAGRLTEAHRLAQARLGAQTAAQVLASWRLVDVADLDATVQMWLRVAVPVIGAQRTASARLAATYLDAFRRLELGPRARAFVPRLAEDLDVAQASTSLTVTGPVRVKTATGQGTPIATAARVAQVSAARAAMRLALEGGRRTLVDSVAADSQALGWARTTSGSPCHFCAMLASRGPVYSKDTARFEAHDGCSCGVEPVYDPDAAWPPGSQRYQDLWRQAKALDGDTTKNFRALVEGRA